MNCAMQPLDILTAATMMLGAQGRGAPRQTFVKLAVSIAYYAVFLYLCTCCANCLVGVTRRNANSWRQIYRAVEHGYAKKQCMNQNEMARFSTEIREFAGLFVELQQMRHKANNDPASKYTRREALFSVNSAKVAILCLRSATKQERTDFAVYILHKNRPA